MYSKTQIKNTKEQLSLLKAAEILLNDDSMDVEIRIHGLKLFVLDRTVIIASIKNDIKKCEDFLKRAT